MGTSRADKAATHERIVQTAAARFREVGVDGLSVADLMRQAGLTHGGFYKHFASREALVDEAVTSALRNGGEALRQKLAARPDVTMEDLVAGYLNAEHRDGPASGCAVTALAADVGRCGAPTRAAYAAQVEANLNTLQALLPPELSPEQRRARGMLIQSALVGALAMARAMGGEHALSDEFIATVRQQLSALAHAAPPQP
ncbi:TetR/AcrR family transcriptional regulator [Amantichitinum ursilacus]|uniref:DNA-binding transcriptional repressor AcrR n=1 Tax=Amantichitinum ursilacus TaxID=857265 RepID=A0A0N0GQA4_9NEIS|nr:TetR/AcrR family transcriptional regulator [Amantichitinum ursilacus]KPC54503.1 DNA-binding transcriptional repressor AcrR [Amantichitinum ursilacus]